MKNKVVYIIKELIIELAIFAFAWFVTYKLIFKLDFKIESFLMFSVIYLLGSVTNKIITKRKEIKNEK